MEMEDEIKKLREVKEVVRLGGGKEKIARQHEAGKLGARERIECLLDPGTFVELNMLVGHRLGAPGDAIIAGYGRIEGRMVCIYSQDATVLGGSIGPWHGRKMYRTIERALEMGVPLIGLHDSPGARGTRLDQSSVLDPSRVSDEKHGGSVFFINTQASGVIPQIAAMLGTCAGASVYSPALNDFIFMVDGISHMFVTGPGMVKTTTGEDLSKDELGGARVHSRISGVADFRMKSEEECFGTVRKLLAFLPQNCRESPPRRETADDPERWVDALAAIVPSDHRKPYDMHQVITQIVDEGDFLEVKAEFAPEMIVGFAPLAGRPVGIVANQPMFRAGSLTVDSSDKQARFIRFCDAFNLPIILLVDTPAYLPGKAQERAGIIRHGAKVLYALCEAVVPKVAVMLRKSYGGGMLGMGLLPGLATDFVFCWPIARFGVLGAEQLVELLYPSELKAAEDPQAFKEQKVSEYHERYNPLTLAAECTMVEDVIEPRETRRCLVRSLQLLESKRVSRYPKRHGNIPL